VVWEPGRWKVPSGRADRTELQNPDCYCTFTLCVTISDPRFSMHPAYCRQTNPLPTAALPLPSFLEGWTSLGGGSSAGYRQCFRFPCSSCTCSLPSLWHKANPTNKLKQVVSEMIPQNRRKPGTPGKWGVYFKLDSFRVFKAF
jgi:hypothetical protein